ncbi:adenylosuccinate lyase [Ceratobasidium sp. AG-Ba]|nr:adenylosuccinate lyase [Ceratobasidium sp. AG-Ba]
MFGNTPVLLAVALAAVTSATSISFNNHCRFLVRPLIKNTNGVTYTGPWLASGQSLSSSVGNVRPTPPF